MFWFSPDRDVVRVQRPDAAHVPAVAAVAGLTALAVGDERVVVRPPADRQGRRAVRVWRTADDEFVLDTDGGFGETLTARLNRFKIRVKADIEPLDWRCVAVRGGACRRRRASSAWGDGVDLLGAGRRRAGRRRRRAAPSTTTTPRIAAGWPAMGAEIVPGDDDPRRDRCRRRRRQLHQGLLPGPGAGRADGQPRLRRRRSISSCSTAPTDDVAGGDVVHDGAPSARSPRSAPRQVLARVRRGVERVRPMTAATSGSWSGCARCAWRCRRSPRRSPGAPTSTSGCARRSSASPASGGSLTVKADGTSCLRCSPTRGSRRRRTSPAAAGSAWT